MTALIIQSMPFYSVGPAHLVINLSLFFPPDFMIFRGLIKVRPGACLRGFVLIKYGAMSAFVYEVAKS